MPQHPRHRGIYHINLLEPFVNPTAECLHVIERNDMDDFTLWEKDSSEQPMMDSKLNEGQRKQLMTLISKYQDTFSSNPGLTAIKIETGDAYPVHKVPYRLTFDKILLVEREIKSRLENGIIRSSHSPWAAPIVLVPKPDKTVRMCVDYRLLNKVTKLDPYPMPQVTDLLDKIAKAQ